MSSFVKFGSNSTAFVPGLTLDLHRIHLVQVGTSASGWSQSLNVLQRNSHNSQQDPSGRINR
jgi:hypothetical protein